MAQSQICFFRNNACFFEILPLEDSLQRGEEMGDRLRDSAYLTLQLKRSRHRGASTVTPRSCSDRVAREIVRSILIDPCSEGR